MSDLEPRIEAIPYDPGCWHVVVPGISPTASGDGHIRFEPDGRLSLTGIPWTLTEDEAARVDAGITLALATRRERSL